ncbi:hypothetical protein KR044_001119 [Drosophila immigrans]|nr:hypothetical protein KR044_001119 [Drosophila immigrans]
MPPKKTSYMTYAPTPNCNYATLQGAQLHHPSSSTATSVLMQAPTQQGNIYTSMGHPAVSGAMTIGPHMLGPSGMGGVSPAYISGTIMVPGHHHTHAGTLRRTLIPTSMGLMSSPSPPPTGMVGMGGMGAMPPHSMASNSGSGHSGHSVYYDSTVPRTLARGLSTESSGQYFYG